MVYEEVVVQVVNEVKDIIAVLQYPVKSIGELVKEVGGRVQPKGKVGVNVVLVLPVDP